MFVLTFFHPVLQALESGDVIRKTVSVTLKVLGVVVLLSGIFVLIGLLKGSFRLPTTSGTLGGILFAAVMAAALPCLAQIFFYRAGSVERLGESRYTVIPIFSILLRGVGEAYAVASVAAGAGGCLFIWLTGLNPLAMLGAMGELLPAYQAEASFLGGLAFLLYLTAAAAVLLIMFYFLAEAVVVMADIAGNVKLLAQAGVAAATIPQPQAAPRCPSCGSELDADSAFCPICGARLGGL